MDLYNVRIVTIGALAITFEFPAMSIEEAKITAESMWEKVSSVLYTDEILETIVEVKDEKNGK